MKTLTNWNIIIVDNCSNVGCDKITTTVNHTRYNVLLYNYKHVYNLLHPLSKSLRYSSGDQQSTG